MTPRAKFITEADINKIAARCWDAMQQASSHDPDHALEIRCIKRDLNILFKKFHVIESRLAVIERQLERLGAPQYRRVA